MNKVETKVELRMQMNDLSWLSDEVKKRVKKLYPGYVSKDGQLLVTSQKHRTQQRNRDDAMQKLSDMLDKASIEPKDRSQWQGLAETTKQNRKNFKRRRGATKASRQGRFDD